MCFVKQLIVNADDFGMTENVNRGILEAHRKGIVTSSTLLANGAAWESAINLSAEAPRLGIGVHLNLSEGIPVSPATQIQTLVDSRRQLHLSPGQLWKALRNGQVRLSEIETELRAQVMRTVDAGITPTHLDGHMHVHVLPGVSEIVIRLAREFRIACIRCPAEQVRNILQGLGGIRAVVTKRRAIALAVSIFAWRFRRQLERAGLLYPEHFYGISKMGFLDLRCLQDILRSLPHGTSELMCHPGYPDTDPTVAGGPFLPRRETELLALTAPAAVRLIAAEGIQLVTYRELAGLRAKHEAAA